MRESLRQLVALQRVDDELAGVEAEIRDLPGRREAAQAERAEATARAVEVREALAARELERRQLESELADTEARKQHLEGQSAQVKSNEAYRALLLEIEQADAAIGDLETRLLEAMEAAEAAQAALGTAEGAARSVGARAERELARIEARSEELEAERERLRALREEAARKLDPALLTRYERVVERRRPGVAVVSTEVCSGCRVGIPPQSLLNLISGDTIVACGSCKRILVHAGVLGEGA